MVGCLWLSNGAQMPGLWGSNLVVQLMGSEGKLHVIVGARHLLSYNLSERTQC